MTTLNLDTELLRVCISIVKTARKAMNVTFGGRENLSLFFCSFFAERCVIEKINGNEGAEGKKVLQKIHSQREEQKNEKKYKSCIRNMFSTPNVGQIY